MGASESRIKEVPSLQVESLLTLFWNLNHKDQKHFMEILEREESQLRVLHQYHQVDVPLPIWRMFAGTEIRWEANKRMIKRWKQLWPYFKGLAKNKSGQLALCLSPDLVTEHTDETLEQAVFRVGLAERKDSMIRIEFDGHVCELQDFLLYGKPNVTDQYATIVISTFQDWMEITEAEAEESVTEAAEIGAEDRDAFDEIFAKQDETWDMLIKKLAQ
jgi:hypothetical protein